MGNNIPGGFGHARAPCALFSGTSTGRVRNKVSDLSQRGLCHCCRPLELHLHAMFEGNHHANLASHCVVACFSIHFATASSCRKAIWARRRSDQFSFICSMVCSRTRLLASPASHVFSTSCFERFMATPAMPPAPPLGQDDPPTPPLLPPPRLCPRFRIQVFKRN